MINIVIVDNHTLVRKGIRALLVSQPDLDVVAEAGTYEEALEQLQLHRVDVVIFDIAMPVPAPGRDSIELIAHVRTAQPHARTLVLTMHTENEYAARALKAGAHGYVTKDVTPELLINAIRRVASGALFLSPNVAQSLALRVALQDDIAPLHKRLSRRELAVFSMIADGKTINDIARRLTLSAKTVSAHKLSVLRKLNMRTVAELVRYAIEHQITCS
ncbi:MAG TPA: response regulator transcription factor [Steroidobacteraceae bacterium]|nr:response regulator transcription factor [Steroidobacteraceae bacterium]